MPNHFLGWQNAPNEVVVGAIQSALSRFQSEPGTIPRASIGEGEGLGVITWTDDPLSIRLQGQLVEAGHSLDVLCLTATPALGTATSEVAGTLDSSFQASGFPSYALAVRSPASGVAYQFTKTAPVKSGTVRIVNTGDGGNEDPIIALAHVTLLAAGLPRPFTAYNYLLIGDLVSNGLARSTMWILSKAGAQVRLLGHPALTPSAFPGIETLHIPPMPTTAQPDEQVVLYFPTEQSHLAQRAYMSSLDYENTYARPLTSVTNHFFCIERDLMGQSDLSSRDRAEEGLKGCTALESLPNNALLAAATATLELVFPISPK